MRPAIVAPLLVLASINEMPALSQQAQSQIIVTRRPIPTVGAYVGSPERQRTQNPWIEACQGRTGSYQSLGAGYWLNGGESHPQAQQLDGERIVRVTRNIQRAVQMLATRPFAPLSDIQLKAFTGVAPNNDARHLHPYLVRSVSASDGAFVRWDGGTLEVTGVAIGECSDVTNRPLVVLLERPPYEVIVNTVGAD